MWTRRLGTVLGVALVLALSGWATAGEGEAPAKAEVKQAEPAAKEKTVDEYRSVISKLSAARRKFITSKPELADAYKQFDERRKQIEKEVAEFYAKLRTMSPELDELEKKKEELEAERKRKDEEARKAKGERRPKKNE